MNTPVNTAPAAAPVVKAPKDEKNGITRPKADTATGRVWAIADAQSAKLQKPAGRKAVIDECVAEKINSATAATQYGRWRKYHGLEGRGVEETTAEAPAATETASVATETPAAV